jgi:hypothetical protein
VREWKLCGLQAHGCLYEVQVILRDFLEVSGLPKLPPAHRLQKMRIAGKYGKSKASKRRYINRRFRDAWHIEQPIEVPEENNGCVAEPAKRYRKATIYPKQMRHKAIFQPLSISDNNSEIIRICFLGGASR